MQEFLVRRTEAYRNKCVASEFGLWLLGAGECLISYSQTVGCRYACLKKKLLIVVGTRPEVLKMAPLIEALCKGHHKFHFVHSGQHFEYNMCKRFLKELALPNPEFLPIEVSSDNPASQTAKIMIAMENFLRRVKPELVLVEGDTNTVLGAALASLKQRVDVGHVEAGLRSHDWRMPEEHNRRMVDHVSKLLFAPTVTSRKTLLCERALGRTWVTGNTIIDTVTKMMPIAEKKSNILHKVDCEEFALATTHRAENVDDREVLSNIVMALVECPLPVVIPIHPRTKNRLHAFGLNRKIVRSKNIILLPPLGYLDFLRLMKKSKVIITDSGGLQEEATAPSIRKPVVVIRESTDRPEAVQAGFAIVVGTRKERILKGVKSMISRKRLPSNSPYGNGRAGERIAGILTRELE